MRLHVLSDLHLSVQGMPVPEVEADVTIIAGDVARPQAAMAWAGQFKRPVLYVPGNHEFYGGSIPAVRQELAEAARAHGVRLLDEDVTVLGGVRFIGATLWTDFEVAGHAARETAMREAEQCLRDFQVIHNADGSHFTPADSVALFRAQSAWLDAALAAPFAGPTVVVTHHAPNAGSIHPRFAGSVLNAGFVSDCTKLLGRSVMWVHGHTHDNFDYVVKGTRVLCNPRGYLRHGVAENPAFNPRLVVDVPAHAGQ